MKTLFVLVAMVSASAAQASVVTCETLDGELRVKASGNGSYLVLSDASVQAGRKTIARFTADAGTLDIESDESITLYIADVDHRFNDSGRKGELLLGTKIGEVNKISVTVPSEDMLEGRGTIVVTKRNGAKKRAALDCSW